MDLNLSGKKVILTGGSRGLGFATLKLFAEEGADVAFCSRNREKVDAAVKELQQAGNRVYGDAIDATDQQAYSSWLNTAAEQLGGCDIFIHNMSSSGSEGGGTDWELGFQLDIKGASTAMDILTPHLEKSGEGSVILMSSTAAVETFVAPFPFNAFKAALITYAKQLSQALGPKNIRVNAVSPGPIEFEAGNWSKIKDSAPDYYNGIVEQIPLGRIGAAEDVARSVVFLSSPAASYVTGTNIVIDGGFTKRVQF